MTNLAATVARDCPDVPEDVVERVTEAVTKEIWALAITECLKFRDQGDRVRQDCIRKFASDLHEQGVAQDLEVLR